jgi:hypothetical protein
MQQLSRTSRSQVEDTQRCPRREFWAYRYPTPGAKVPGLSPARPSVEMSIGTAVHAGCELLVEAGRYIAAAPLNSVDLDTAIAAGLVAFDAIWQPYIATTDPTIEQPPWLIYQLAESRAMIEALISLFYYAPTGLQLLLDNYEILDIEPEITVPFADWLEFSGRPDIVVRHKRTQQLYTIDLKTSKEWDDRAQAAADTDNQGISQAICARYKYNEDSAGEIRWVLLKGGKRKGDDGIYRATSGLIRPYKNTKAMFYDASAYAVSNFYTCVEEHEHRWAKSNHKINGKNACPGGKLHSRGDDWQQVNLWEDGGITVREWVAWLAENESEQLDRLVVVPVAFKREGAELVSWQRQVASREHRAVCAAHRITSALKGGGPIGTWLESPLVMLDYDFYQDRTSCSYPFQCTFYDVCHKGGAERLLDPELFQPGNEDLAAATIAELGFRPREDNHPTEIQMEVLADA